MFTVCIAVNGYVQVKISHSAHIIKHIGTLGVYKTNIRLNVLLFGLSIKLNAVNFKNNDHENTE